MTPTLEADPAASTDAEPDIMALAMAADAGTLDHNASTPAKPATAPQDTTSTPADSGEDARNQAEQPKPESKANDKPATPEKPETPYQKAAKDTERKDKSWKALEAEKAQVRAEAQQIAATKAEIEQLRRQVQELKTPAKPATDASGNTAEVYDQLAQKYADEGDTQMAKLAREQAEKLRTQAPTRAPAATAPAEVWKTPEFQTEWQRHTAELLAADPTLNDPANPLVQTANMLTSHKEWAPYFRANPAGIKAALEVAKLMRVAASVDTLRKEHDAAKAEVERLTKLTQPRRGGPMAPAPGEKSLAEMSDAEADAEIRRLAEAADRGGR